MKKLKIAFFGIDHNHCAAKVAELKTLPDLFEIKGIVCENDEVYQRRVINDKTYEGLKFISEEELFLMDDIDAVVVEPAVPNLIPMAQKCIDKGWHIHLDKPAGVDLEEYKRLLDSAKEKELIIQMGYMYRYNNAIQYLINKVKDGFVGNVFSVDTSMSTGLNRAFKEKLISYNVKSPSMYIYGCHLIDLILTIWGVPNRVIPFNKKTLADNLDFEDSGFALLEYDNGVATIRINSSEINGWERRELTVCGDQGTISIKPIENPTRIYECSKENAKSWSSCAQEITLPKQVGRYRDQFIHLSQMINKEVENPYSYEHDYLVHKILLESCGYKVD